MEGRKIQGKANFGPTQRYMESQHLARTYYGPGPAFYIDCPVYSFHERREGGIIFFISHMRQYSVSSCHIAVRLKHWQLSPNLLSQIFLFLQTDQLTCSFVERLNLWGNNLLISQWLQSILASWILFKRSLKNILR